MPTQPEEFKEIAHCGGQFNINVRTDEEGKRGIQLGWSHSRPTPSSIIAFYALPQGIPVGTIQLGGIGTPFNPAPTSDCLTIFVASDSHSMFGHQCPNCGGYWRSVGAPSRWEMTCAYCGIRASAHYFRTVGQKKYIKECCERIQNAIYSEEDGDYTIDMDEVADAIGVEHKKHDFYYAEESQQNKYKCDACGDINDVLGKYAFCSTCGTHNGLKELKKELDKIRQRANDGGPYEACVKDAVSAYDSFCRQIAKLLVENIPMTPQRKKEWGRKLFHNLINSSKDFEQVFDIKPLRKIINEELDFITLMFHRRHIYEHNGGEADAKYLEDSGDTTVRLKQVVRETQTSANKAVDIIYKIASNVQSDFHTIFSPVNEPIEYHQQKKRK